MTTPQRRKLTAGETNVVTLPITKNQMDRLITVLEVLATGNADTNKHVAYAAEKIGDVANGLAGAGRFMIRRGGWITAVLLFLAQVAFPSLKEIVDKLPPFPQ